MDFLNRPIPKSFRTSSSGWDIFLNKLQANIIKHHNRTHAWFVFIRFEKPAQAGAIKKWISDFSDHITTAYKQLTIPSQNNLQKEMLCSCLISREGLSFLNIQNADIQFPKFEYSEVHRISEDEQKIEGFFTTPSHLLILLAHESKEELQVFLDEKIFKVLDARGIEYLPPLMEKGTLKRDNNGKAFEAFGFRDGISQPEVLREKIEEYKTDKWNPAATLGLTFFDMKTMGVEDYGSFAVYLKIEQHKEVFDENVKKIAGAIKDVMDPDPIKDFDQKIKLAEAYLMGRFKDGTPVINANKQGGQGQDLNNFNYGEPYYALAQNKCPLFAHIFKSNPRDKPDVRIFRRGIPFQVADGLHFLSYQCSIDEQFMKIYEDWMGHRRHPAPNSDFGRDPIMMTDKTDGDVNNPSRSRKRIPKRWGEGNPDDSDHYFDMKDFDLPKPTTVRGVVFYFVPSLHFLKNIQNL